MECQKSSSSGSHSLFLGDDWPKIRIPESCKGVDVIVGIDEAGRGPVLGSLVYCAAFWPLSENEAISKLGFDDSKVLKEGERERLLQRIQDHPSIGWVIEEITAQEISEQMLRPHPTSLNTVSYNGVIRMLETIRDVKPEREAPIVHHVYVDTVGDPEFYKSKLVSAMGNQFSTEGFTIEKKADATYRIVSAASIIAKVTRDHLLESWSWKGVGKIDQAYGSGYPSDETCVNWMNRSLHPLFGYPSDLVRFSWSTTKNVFAEQQAIPVEWACDEEENEGENIRSFFGGAGRKPKRKKRTEFFVKRKMKHLEQFSDLTTATAAQRAMASQK